MTVAISLNPYAVFYLPAWVVHPTIISTDDFLFNRKPAEQAGGAKGWRPAKAGREGILQQHDGIARSAINVCCLRCEAPKPSITYYNDIISNNDIKWPDNLNDGTEDANHNGRIDGDNGDGIYQPESENWKETSPNEVDSDIDGIDDKTEKDNGYNPNKQDTDGDGLTDKEEDKNGNGQYDKANDETNALEIDTDGDGMQDKLELDGWTVCIRYEATGEEKERYTVTSNPMEAHSDSDNLNDFDEYKNTTDPNKADTDGDGKNDYEELNNDFNSSATGIDGEPPEIWHYDCKYKIKKTKLFFVKVPSGLEVWMEVGARDIFGIDNIEIFISGLEDKKVYTDNDDNVTVEFEWTLSGIDEYKRAFFDGFDINVTATDRNNNVGFRNEKLDSIKDIVVSAFLGPLLAIAKFIAELASGMFDWIFNTVESLFTSPLEGINSLIEWITENLVIFYEKYLQSNGDRISSLLEDFADLMNHPLVWVLTAIYVIINVVLLLLNSIPIVAIISAVLSLIIVLLTVIFSENDNDDDDDSFFASFIVDLLFDSYLGNDEEEGTKNSEKKSAQGLAFSSVSVMGGPIMKVLSKVAVEKELKVFIKLGEKAYRIINLVPWWVPLAFSGLVLVVSYSIGFMDKFAPGVIPEDDWFRAGLTLCLNLLSSILCIWGAIGYATQPMDTAMRGFGIVFLLCDIGANILSWWSLLTSQSWKNTFAPAIRSLFGYDTSSGEDEILDDYPLFTEKVLETGSNNVKFNFIRFNKLCEPKFTFSGPRNTYTYEMADENKFDILHPLELKDTPMDLAIRDFQINYKSKTSGLLDKNTGSYFDFSNNLFENSYEEGILVVSFNIYDHEFRGDNPNNRPGPDNVNINHWDKSDKSNVVLLINTVTKEVYIDTNDDNLLTKGDDDQITDKLLEKDYYDESGYSGMCYRLYGKESDDVIAGELYFDIN